MDLELQQFVAQNLGKILPELKPKLVSLGKKLAGKREIDLYVKDEHDREYYIEVKTRGCNRIDIARAVEYKALISKISPQAQLILVCMSVAKEIKEILEKVDIKVVSFRDLDLSVPNGLISGEYRQSKALSPTEERAYFALLRETEGIASTSAASALLSIPRSYSKNILDSLNRKGVVYRIGRGKYILIPPEILHGRKGYVADPIVVANQLLSEYCVAYQSAAYLHGLAHQVPFITTLMIPTRRRPIQIGNGRLQFVTVKRKRLDWGIVQMKYGNRFIKVTDLHRTILDCIDRPDLCGGIAEVARMISTALEKTDFDQEKLAKYAKEFDNKAVVQRLGFILERTGRQKVAKAAAILKKIKSNYTYALDPQLQKKGRLSEEWGILENVSLRG